MNYIRISEGVNKYKLIPVDENMWEHISSNDLDYYTSLYQYNESHYNMWKTTGTVAGIRDTLTNKLLFDFDKKDHPEIAQKDAIELVSRILKTGIKEDNIQVSFSGSKGFCVELETTEKFTPEEFKSITFKMAEGLDTFDKVVNDSQRLIRVVGTKHPKSGLYKIPLSVAQLSELSIDEIKTRAKNLDSTEFDSIVSNWKEIVLPEVIQSYKQKSIEPAKSTTETHDLNMRFKPKWLSEAKYALQEGYFGDGERNTALMILASTYRNQGFNKEIAYRMLKGVAEVQSVRNNVPRFSDVEIYNKIVKVVYSPEWHGGTYSYENTPLLQDVTKRLGLKVEKSTDLALVPVTSVTDVFRKFATEIDNNTIKLGIKKLDDNLRITTSMLVGLLAPPSGGKTTASLGILNTLSKSGLDADFYSLDMGAPLVFQRLIQKHTGLSGDKIFEMYKSKDKRVEEFESIISKEYINVRFCFKSGISVDNIRQHLTERREKEGKISKLIVIDYLECLQGPYSDPNSNTSMISQQLKDLANDFDICVLLLLQPQKHAGDPSSELLSYRNIKGASAIEQACSVVLSLWRPGFSPKNPEDDKYMTFAILKNRMGNLGMFDFAFDGLTGQLSELTMEEEEDLRNLRKRKDMERSESL